MKGKRIFEIKSTENKAQFVTVLPIIPSDVKAVCRMHRNNSEVHCSYRGRRANNAVTIFLCKELFGECCNYNAAIHHVTR